VAAALELAQEAVAGARESWVRAARKEPVAILEADTRGMKVGGARGSDGRRRRHAGREGSEVERGRGSRARRRATRSRLGRG
jgi:hypothetical protein